MTDVQPNSDDLTESERLGLSVALAHGAVIVQRDQARDMAAQMEADLAECREYLAEVLDVIDHQGWRSTWAQNTVRLERAREYLADDGLGD